MKNTITLGLMMLGLFATSVQAETKHCYTVEDCRTLITEAKSDLAVLLKDVTPELTGILRTGVSQRLAEAICEGVGMRLPTARELALVAQSLGAEGISETRKDGYRLIRGTDSAGNPDDFYYSNKGYKRPAGEPGYYWFWSSSVHPDGSVFAYGLDNFNGVFGGVNRSDDFGSGVVRCFDVWSR